MLNKHSIVIVSGHSGSGKSAIIHHIALKYLKNRWLVKPVDSVEEIKEIYKENNYIKNKTLFVLNDPVGKESIDEASYSSWRKNEQTLKHFLENVKLIVTCRKSILDETRVQALHLLTGSNVVVIDENQNKLSDLEKRQIFKMHNPKENVSEIILREILKIDTYFPLLCKLFANKKDPFEDRLNFFREPKEVFQKEINNLKCSNKEKYCGLVCLVFFNNKVCSNVLTNNYKLFKECLNFCGLPDFTAPATIIDNLGLLKGLFVTKIGNAYQFLHDFVSEVTTFVFGTDYPVQVIKYADIRFLRRRVRLHISVESTSSFIISLRDEHTEELVDRFLKDIFGVRFMEVVLNPCLRNKIIIDALLKKMNQGENDVNLMLREIETAPEEQNEKNNETNVRFSRLDFIYLEKKVSPLFVLIVFCHDDLSFYCMEAIKQAKKECLDAKLFSAVCCNGSRKLFNLFSKQEVQLCLTKTWGDLYPVDILSLFHNHDLLEDVMTNISDAKEKSNQERLLSPLALAILGDSQRETQNKDLLNQSSRDKTIQILLRDNNEVNSFENNGDSLLLLACEYGYDSIVDLLLRHGAEVNLLNKFRECPLARACENGHDKTVQLLLSHGAEINLCNCLGESPLYIACKNGHYRTVEILLNNGANVTLYDTFRISPLSIACKNGHFNTIKLLLNYGADVNFCDMFEHSPLARACRKGYNNTVILLLQNGANVNYSFCPLYVACENGHKETVQLLLDNNADVNLGNNDIVNPLYKACELGYDEIVELLIDKGARFDLYDKFGNDALYIACKNGYADTVQVLLDSGADMNSSNKNGDRYFCIACEKGHDRVVKVLLRNGVDVNLCDAKGISPIYIACRYGHENIVQLLLDGNADVNLCNSEGVSPLSRTCELGRNHIVSLLIQNGANVNLCDKNGLSPLYRACENGHYTSVQHLLNNGVYVNLCNSSGVSSLYKCCENGHERIVQLLIQNGAEVNLRNYDLTSPLNIACANGHYVSAEYLLNNGAEINSCNSCGVSPLYAACRNGHDSIVQLLLNNNATLRICDNENSSPFSKAVENGHDSTVQVIVKSGKEISFLNEDLDHLLYTACIFGSFFTARFLLQNGADVNFCNENGSSPLHKACENGYDNIVQLLLRYDADIISCDGNRISPICLAYLFGHKSTVDILENNGATLCCSHRGIFKLYSDNI